MKLCHHLAQRWKYSERDNEGLSPSFLFLRRTRRGLLHALLPSHIASERVASFATPFGGSEGERAGFAMQR